MNLYRVSFFSLCSCLVGSGILAAESPGAETALTKAAGMDQFLSYEVQLGNQASLRASAIKAGRLWVAGGKGSVFISDNEGKSWRDVSPHTDKPLDFRDIQVFDRQTALIMSVGSGTDSRLLLTHDAGQSWTELLRNREKNGFFDSIDFWDRDHGLLLGDPVNGYYVVMRTQDGGRTWKRVPRQNIPPMRAKEAAFAASGNTLIATGDHQAWFTTGGFGASVYYSADAGKHWRRLDIPLYQETQTAGGYALGVNRDNQVFVLGGDYQDRDGAYANLGRVTALGERLSFAPASNRQKGLRTALACTRKLCLTLGKLAADASFDQGTSWVAIQQTGYYTLAASGSMILAAGALGRIKVFVTE